MIFPVCAMADESAIFIRDTQVTCLGEIKDFSPNMIMRGRDAMTIRLIASDLDGTLYRDDKTISERTKNTLAEAAKRKICFVPVTGRSILGVDRLIRELPWMSEYTGDCPNGTPKRAGSRIPVSTGRIPSSGCSRCLSCDQRRKRVMRDGNHNCGRTVFL